MTPQLNIIINVLKALKPELARKYAVSSIGLFGSIVRGDDSTASDIDIIVDFSKPIGIEFIDLADLLERKLQKPIDLVSKKGVKPHYFRSMS